MEKHYVSLQEALAEEAAKKVKAWKPKGSRVPSIALSDRQLFDVKAVSAFLAEKCIVNIHQRVVCQVLFKAWQEWCDSVGRSKIGYTCHLFGRDLRTASPGIGVKQSTGGQRSYLGVGLVGAVPTVDPRMVPRQDAQ